MSLEDPCLEYFAALIKKESGIVYDSHNMYHLKVRLESIAKEFDVESIAELYDHAQSGGNYKLKDKIVDTATNNETFFFRDAHVFEALGEHFRQRIIGEPDAGTFHVWSCASSTGQEVYTLLFVLDKVAKGMQGKRDFKIIASDISPRVIAQARSAIYDNAQVGRGLDQLQLNQYFNKIVHEGRESWQVKEALRSRVQFMKINLIAKNWNVGQCDLILCRNVLIYQEISAKKMIVEHLAQHLRVGGVLVLGGSESLIGVTDSLAPFQVEGHRATFYTKKAEAVPKAG